MLDFLIFPPTGLTDMTKQTVHKHTCRLMVHKLEAFGSVCLFYWRREGKEKPTATLPCPHVHEKASVVQTRDAVGTQQ